MTAGWGPLCQRPRPHSTVVPRRLSNGASQVGRSLSAVHAGKVARGVLYRAGAQPPPGGAFRDPCTYLSHFSDP